MDDQRAEFEAWWQSTGKALCGCSLVPDHTSPNQVFAGRGFAAGYQAATQRQQERIAELEAQVQALSLDAGRYRWIRSNVGDAYMDLATASEDTIDQRIDAEIAARKGDA